jgi:hypothetical protein
VIPGSYVLAHSPLTGPAAWGTLPSLLREQRYDVVVINVQDDEKAPFADRYVGQSTAQISAAEPAPPTIFVAHSGAGPLLPAITASLPRSYRRGGLSFSTPDSQDLDSRPDWICSARRTAALRPSFSTRCDPVCAFRHGP